MPLKGKPCGDSDFGVGMNTMYRMNTLSSLREFRIDDPRRGSRDGLLLQPRLERARLHGLFANSPVLPAGDGRHAHRLRSGLPALTER